MTRGNSMKRKKVNGFILREEKLRMNSLMNCFRITLTDTRTGKMWVIWKWYLEKDVVPGYMDPVFDINVLYVKHNTRSCTKAIASDRQAWYRKIWNDR